VRSKLWLLSLSGVGTACLICGTAAAQTAAPAANANGELEEVVVTAEHRSTDLQNVGLAVTAISGDEITQHADVDLAQVLQGVPGVVLQGVTDGPSQQSVQGAGGPPNISIRGLGTPSPNTVGSVAVYEDGVLLQGGGLNFFDMNRVEVLRGPQGTLYGRGATAGAVNFITNDPTQTFEADGRVQFGNYDLVATQGMLNIPLSSDFSTRIAFNEVHHSGYFNNGQSNEDDYSVRAKLLFKPSEAFSLLIGFTDYQSNGVGDGQVQLTGNPSPTAWTTSVPGGPLNYNPIAYRKTYADLEWDLGFARLTYIGGYQNTNSQFGTFCTCFTPGPPPATGLTYQYVNEPYNDTWTHELRLASAGTSPFSWQGGVYYFSNRMFTNFEPGYTSATSIVPPTFDVTQGFKPTSIGLFGEANYAVTSATTVTAGVRETFDHAVQTQQLPFGANNDFDQRLNHFDYKARVQTQLTPENMLYGMISTGYRPGGYVNGVPLTDEHVTAYEVGSKNRVNSLATLNGAVYYYNYSGFQNITNIPNNVGPPTSVDVPLPATFYGAELEAAFQLTPDDRLVLSPSAEEAKYTRSATGFDTDNGTIPNTPKFSFSGRYAHRFELAGNNYLSWEADGHYQTSELTDFDGSNYPTTNPSFFQKSYSILNSSLVFTPASEKYTVSLYGKNLGNTLVKLTVYNASPPTAYISDPLTFGVAFSAKIN
jgi:iron complex outermembrane recepter protein